MWQKTIVFSKKIIHKLTAKLIFFLCLSCNQIFAIKFDQKIAGNHVTLTMRDDNGTGVGLVSYEKIPMTTWYAIHSLYVFPEFRRKGYGTALVQHVLQSLQKAKATCAYIQPGPFELHKGEFVRVSDAHKPHIHDLVKLYKKLGFKPTNAVTKIIVAIYYCLAGIDENSRYLMIKML